jgi:hypothetical protein
MESKALSVSVEREAYDFSDVPEDELQACLFYEYLRESAPVRHEVKHVREQFLKQVKDREAKVGDSFTLGMSYTKVTNLEDPFEFAVISILAGTPDFPDILWQKLSHKMKEQFRDFPDRARRLHNEAFLKQNPMLIMDAMLNNHSLGSSTLNAWKVKRTPERYQKVLATHASELERLLMSGFFQINMGYTKDQLVDAFRDWLNRNHPRADNKPKERRGRKTARDALNALGAMRLRYCCGTLEQAQQLIAPLRSKPKGMSYRDRTAFNRACDAAVRHFQALLQLPAGQLPIHFTKGWQK